MDRLSLTALARAHPDLGHPDNPYGDAMLQWGAVLGRPAPPATDRDDRLDPTFVEWPMELPPSWTDDLPRRARLRALGNSVVPRQATTALRLLLTRARTSPTPNRPDHTHREHPPHARSPRPPTDRNTT